MSFNTIVCNEQQNSYDHVCLFKYNKKICVCAAKYNVKRNNLEGQNDGNAQIF